MISKTLPVLFSACFLFKVVSINLAEEPAMTTLQFGASTLFIQSQAPQSRIGEKEEVKERFNAAIKAHQQTNNLTDDEMYVVPLYNGRLVLDGPDLAEFAIDV